MYTGNMLVVGVRVIARVVAENNVGPARNEPHKMTRETMRGAYAERRRCRTTRRYAQQSNVAR